MNSFVVTAFKSTHPSPNVPAALRKWERTSVSTVRPQSFAVPPVSFINTKTSRCIALKYALYFLN